MRKGLDVTTLAALRRLLRDDGGATAIEYGLIAALIAVAIIAALTALQGNITATFTSVGNAMAGAAGGN